MLDKAIRINAVAFEGKHDKGGVPYIMHCLHVMNGVKHLGQQAMVAAVSHDLIEDTDWTAEQLSEEGFDDFTIQLIVVLTHVDGEEYMEYISRISICPIARAIKMADLRHNSDINRMKGLRQKDKDRLEKYHHAYAYLRDIENV